MLWHTWKSQEITFGSHFSPSSYLKQIISCSCYWLGIFGLAIPWIPGLCSCFRLPTHYRNERVIYTCHCIWIFTLVLEYEPKSSSWLPMLLHTKSLPGPISIVNITDELQQDESKEKVISYFPSFLFLLFHYLGHKLIPGWNMNKKRYSGIFKVMLFLRMLFSSFCIQGNS